MADEDGGASDKQNRIYKSKNLATGIVPLPAGSRGPKSLYIRRNGNSFGFTLRHFIVYPPDSIADHDGRLAAIGAISAPMDTIFVKHVKEDSPAKAAGLQCGDRLVGVNRIPVTDKSYSEVVQLIQNSPEYLHLLVIPKEDDIIQRYFSETAYNPASNQYPVDRQEAQLFLTQTFSQHPRELQVDAASWRLLKNISDPRGRKSEENLLSRQYEQHWRPKGGTRTAQSSSEIPKMGRRASDGCTLDESYYQPEETIIRQQPTKMKTMYKSQEQPARYPNTAGCRLSLDAGRRESDSSLNSSLVDGSKDSLVSYGSSSTLTGHETDDSAIMTRYRKSFQQKEEFLKMSSNNAAKQKEFYSRPKKLERSMWPPNETLQKPTLKNFQRVKDDIECERAQQQTSKQLNGDEEVFSDNNRIYPPGVQIVHHRAKQFESGKPLPEDDPLLSDRTSFYRSELARLSSKKLVPNASERAQEYEIRAEQVSPPKRLQRDSRSVESTTSSGSSSGSDSVITDVHDKRLSGNVLISTGSKYIHCPPPSDYGKQSFVDEVMTPKMRARSNSAESWILDKKPVAVAKPQEEHGGMDICNDSMNYTTKPLIPVPVERMHFTPSVSVTPAPNNEQTPKAVRPTQLDLEGPKRPANHLKPPSIIASVEDDNKAVVVKRRTKSTNLDEERVTRRESYLKATEGSRMTFESDLSDGDISPRVLRSGSLSGNSSSSASLDKEKDNNVIKEGVLHCKITEIDGKRFGDRSWKQIWICLRGPKLFLYKDKHHQSPMGGDSSLEHSLSSGVDMRASVVRVAEDYTKRKHVLRVSSVKPCRSEFLLQAENTEELAEWVKALQEQMATNTELEAKINNLGAKKQQAVPQTSPAMMSIQIQGSSHLSPQPSTKSKTNPSRNRSPTGQSPVSKTRKPSQVVDPSTSPKLKTWRGRVVKQFRKMHGASSPSSPNAPEGSTFGIGLDQCQPSTINPYVPRFVEMCTDIVDNKGLQTVGIYRVPGNNASITALSEEVNRSYDYNADDDPRWNDLHVVSSLLKSYFRKLPDSLVTNVLYPEFIKADKIEDPEARMKELKRLIKSLPRYNYETLKHIMLHLKRVVDHCDVNKMEAKNLAIVFGPNIVRPEEDNMENMVNNMTHQCKIVETLITCGDWFFADSELDDLPVPALACYHTDEGEPVNNQALLLDNLSKFEAFKDKEKNVALFSSIISAAQRKVKRKVVKGGSDHKDDIGSTGGATAADYASDSSFLINDLKYSTREGDDKSGVIPTTVTDMETGRKQPVEKVPWFNYSTDKDNFHRRIENFKQETEAMLQRPRKVEISVASLTTKDGIGGSSGNVQVAQKPNELLKTHSASNVFNRTMINVGNNGRNSMVDNGMMLYNINKNGGDYYERDLNKNLDSNGGRYPGYPTRMIMRRGSSVENLNSSISDLNANAGMKKVKYENEESSGRVGSLDSINKVVGGDDDTDLVASLTKLYDKKLEEEIKQASLLSGEGLPYVDESPEKHARNRPKPPDKENIPQETYRNPSLHKTIDSSMKESSRVENEKDEDSSMDKPKTLTPKNKITIKRSESLNKPIIKVKCSESLRRSESLTKNEKTESNLNKRRELVYSIRKTKETTKLKRKNSKPDRSIKRRHTVGGTKDPDKITYWDNNHKDETSSNKENKEKKLRTSSPDLSSMRRERLFFEINLIGPENMVVALRQHLIGGARPQSFPDTAVYKVPLESHV